MPTEIETTVREYYELVDAGDYEALVNLFAEDVRYERPGQGAITGRDELRTFYNEGRPLEDGAHEIHDVVTTDDRAAVRGQFTGDLDGETVTFDFADFHEFANGEIVQRYTFTDRGTV